MPTFLSNLFALESIIFIIFYAYWSQWIFFFMMRATLESQFESLYGPLSPRKVLVRFITPFVIPVICSFLGALMILPLVTKIGFFYWVGFILEHKSLLLSTMAYAFGVHIITFILSSDIFYRIGKFLQILIFTYRFEIGNNNETGSIAYFSLLGIILVYIVVTIVSIFHMNINHKEKILHYGGSKQGIIVFKYEFFIAIIVLILVSFCHSYIL